MIFFVQLSSMSKLKPHLTIRLFIPSHYLRDFTQRSSISPHSTEPGFRSRVPPFQLPVYYDKFGAHCTILRDLEALLEHDHVEES